MVAASYPPAAENESPDCSLLTSPDLHALLHRPSLTCTGLLASSPDSLFSPKPSQDLLLSAADSSGLFADIFPSGLLFPSPPALAAAAPCGLDAPIPSAAAAAARLPKKLFSTFEQLPAAAPAPVRMSDASATIPYHAASGAAVAAAAAGTTVPAGACGAYTLLRPAAYNLMVRLDDCAPCNRPGQQEAAEPALKRQRTAFSEPQPCQPASSAPLDRESCYSDEEEDDEEEDASDMDFDPSGTSEAQLGGGPTMGEYYYLGQGAGGVQGRPDGGGGSGKTSRLEHKRARNREAARRLRQRQRQQLSQLEEMMGSQYTTIQGLLGKLGTLTKEMKCTSQENDLLKHLLTTAAAAAAPGDSASDSLVCRPGPSAAAQQLPAGGLLGSSNDDEVDAVLMDGPLFGSLSLPLGSPQAPYLLPSSHQPRSRAGTATPAGCSPTKADALPRGGHSSGPSAAPSPTPQPRPPAALLFSLPPSPFQSPTKQQRGVPSPSKPHTPQRPAMRSPFAGPQRRPASLLGAALAEGDYARMAGVACATGDAAPSAAASLLMVPVCGAPAAPAGAGAKAALLEQLAGGGPGAPLAHGVALMLQQRLQERQAVELGAEAAGPHVTDEEAVVIAATALQQCQGDVNASIMQLLAWSGLAVAYPLAASH
ncbi:hypothetical protein N2152v2_011172 [Parachlorella kessleri]